MSRLQPKLDAMFALAHEHSDSARVELANMLADVFLNGENQLSLREQELVNELIDQLLVAANRSPTIRAHLVEKFADKASMPHKVALSLAADLIETAKDVLILNQSLTDDDLINIVTSKGVQHAAAVAQRARVSEAVADALITTGDVAVMQLVAENLGAQLSTRAISILADTARFTVALREPVMTRPEMNYECATRLYWWVSQDLRRYALKRFGIASGQIDHALAKTIEELLGYHALDKANDDIMNQIADWLEDRGVISTRILPQVLRLGHFRLFNILLARLTKMELPLVDLIVSEAGGRGLAVICRSLNVDKAGFVSYFLLSRAGREGDHVVHPRELSHALGTFDKLSVELAKDLLSSWQKNPEYLTSKRDDDLVLEA